MMGCSCTVAMRVVQLQRPRQKHSRAPVLFQQRRRQLPRTQENGGALASGSATEQATAARTQGD